MSCRLITKRKKESPPPSSTVVERQARISRTRSKLPSQPTRASQHGDAGGRSATLSLIAWLRRVHGPAFFSLTPARRPHECTASPIPGRIRVTQMVAWAPPSKYEMRLGQVRALRFASKNQCFPTTHGIVLSKLVGSRRVPLGLRSASQEYTSARVLLLNSCMDPPVDDINTSEKRVLNSLPCQHALIPACQHWQHAYPQKLP